MEFSVNFAQAAVDLLTVSHPKITWTSFYQKLHRHLSVVTKHETDKIDNNWNYQEYKKNDLPKLGRQTGLMQCLLHQGFIKQLKELPQRNLVHAVYKTHFADEEIQDTATRCNCVSKWNTRPMWKSCNNRYDNTTSPKFYLLDYHDIQGNIGQSLKDLQSEWNESLCPRNRTSISVSSITGRNWCRNVFKSRVAMWLALMPQINRIRWHDVICERNCLTVYETLGCYNTLTEI